MLGRSDRMALFFTADTHFGDHRTINIQKRPFADVAAARGLSSSPTERSRPDSKDAGCQAPSGPRCIHSPKKAVPLWAVPLRWSPWA